jgi:hypothetical protein
MLPSSSLTVPDVQARGYKEVRAMVDQAVNDLRAYDRFFNRHRTHLLCNYCIAVGVGRGRRSPTMARSSGKCGR